VTLLLFLESFISLEVEQGKNLKLNKFCFKYNFIQNKKVLHQQPYIFLILAASPGLKLLPPPSFPMNAESCGIITSFPVNIFKIKLKEFFLDKIQSCDSGIKLISGAI
jgi:hypothetical protein